jgi:GR25 family glycosyltransferase involved in LPS biosynthesis
VKSLPVLIIAYARHQNIIKLVRQIAGRLTSQIYLSIDGPKNLKIARIQESMISEVEFIAKEQKVNISIWWRDRNLGVGASVPTAIDWLFSRENAGVIIEDDLELEDDFFKFVHANIHLVNDSSQIALVSGSRFLPSTKPPTTLFSKYPMIWGWATTKIRWNQLKEAYFEPLNFPPLFPKNSAEGFWSVGCYRARVGQIDTWDLPLVVKMIEMGWFCLVPPTNLITNIGVDSFASHTKKLEFPIGIGRDKLPEQYEVDLLNLKRLASEYDSFMNEAIYKIRVRHMFSPLKLWLRSHIFKNFSENLLADRLKRVDLPSL